MTGTRSARVVASRWLITVFVCASVAVRAQSRDVQKPPDTSAKAVVALATASLKTYQEALKFVLSDERTVQEVLSQQGRQMARRVTSGEYFLTYLPADGGWVGARDIAVVDDVPIEGRDNLRELLSRGSIAKIGRQLADRNARYNIGTIARNFNDPMLAFAVLSDQHRGRFKFSRRRVEPTPTGPLVTVSFSEGDGPTLVRGADGKSVRSKGEFVIDAVTGQVRRALITLALDGTEASLTTVFAMDDKLALWLPTSFTERYEHRSRRANETVVVESTYTNYRQFNVSVIIK